jgi:hypothetical protein
MADKAERKKDYPCLKCDKHVKKNDSAVLCNMCEMWIHKDCAKLNDALFDHLVKQQKHVGSIYWSCVSCTSFSAKFHASLGRIDNRVKAVETTVEKQSTDIAALQDKVKDMGEKLDNSKETDGKMRAEVQENAEIAVFSEMRDRENRRNNIVVHGLTEPDAKIKDKTNRIAKDMEKIQDLFSKLEVTIEADDVVKYARRLGERPVGDAGPRPLLIGFKSLDSKQTILDNTRKLSEKEDVWSNVSVISDLTKRQREEEKKMRQEADRLNAERSKEDEKNWLWKVVGRRGERRLVKTKPVEETGRSTRARPR